MSCRGQYSFLIETGTLTWAGQPSQTLTFSETHRNPPILTLTPSDSDGANFNFFIDSPSKIAVVVRISSPEYYGEVSYHAISTIP
jgi:hypothetical protein